jgi:uncharacterized phage-like protein YoqJ
MAHEAQPASCCFTGHRPEHLPWGREETRRDCGDFYLRLWQATEELLHRGCRLFYVGMARGVDMMAAQIVLGLREAQPHRGLRLIAVCPYARQPAHWGAQDRRLHQLILALADEVVVLEEAYSPGCFHRRNRYMVDRCAFVIAGYDGATRGGTSYTVDYARRRGREIRFVPPYKKAAPPP